MWTGQLVALESGLLSLLPAREALHVPEVPDSGLDRKEGVNGSRYVLPGGASVSARLDVDTAGTRLADAEVVHFDVIQDKFVGSTIQTPTVYVNDQACVSGARSRRHRPMGSVRVCDTRHGRDEGRSKRRQRGAFISSLRRKPDGAAKAMSSLPRPTGVSRRSRRC